jgi:hypothetical protein
VTLALAGLVVAYLVCAELFKPLAISGALRRGQPASGSKISTKST